MLRIFSKKASPLKLGETSEFFAVKKRLKKTYPFGKQFRTFRSVKTKTEASEKKFMK